MNLPNDTKIRFCNAFDAMRRHSQDCPECTKYLATGDGDLCEKGKTILAEEMVYTDTTAMFSKDEMEGI